MFKVGFDALIGVPADLPEHQSDQDRHGAGPDCCPLQPGQPLREPLRRSQPGTFIQYMELGQTVLCNLENLYESLYDALNQVPSYSTWSWARLLSSASWRTSMRASTTPSSRYLHTVHGAGPDCCPLQPGEHESLYDALNQVPSYSTWSWARLLSAATWRTSTRASTKPSTRYFHTVPGTSLLFARSAVRGRE